MELFNANNRLHTEVLEEIYGKIDLQVLYQDEEIRECLLVDSRYIARTYALTFKNASTKQNKGISAIDKSIQKGESIGRTFKKNGFAIIKNVIAVYLIEIPWWLQVAFDTTELNAKIRVSEFFVRKNAEDDLILYGTIAEIYSPLFRKAELSSFDLLQINPSQEAMLSLGFSRNEAEGFICNPFGLQWGEQIIRHSTETQQIKQQISAIINK